MADLKAVIMEKDYCSLSGCLYGPVIQSKKWYVYIHRKKTNGKIFYVGIGRYNRCNQVNQRSDYWKKTFTKHGRIVEILFYGLSKEEAINKEKDLIRKYKSENKKICNLTDGGEFIANSIKKIVYAYFKDGNLLRKFESISEANAFFGLKHNNSIISRCIKNKNRTYLGYCFSDKMHKRYNYKKPDVHNKKAVFQYDSLGNFVKKWESIKSVDFIKVHSSISNCLDKNLKAYNYFWRSYYKPRIDVPVVKPALKSKKPIVLLITNQKYQSIQEAVRTTDYTKKKIEIELKKPNGIFKYGN